MPLLPEEVHAKTGNDITKSSFQTMSNQEDDEHNKLVLLREEQQINNDDCFLSTVEEFRKRLHRQNIIINTIRKAYHRDVVTVKEYIVSRHHKRKCQKRLNTQKHETSSGLSNGATLNDNITIVEEEDEELTLQNLHLIPSLDIRPALKLFAPAECELKVRPCKMCGGTLEVVHRECSRVAQMQDFCSELQQKEKDLRLQSTRSELCAKKDRDRLKSVEVKLVEERTILTTHILKLKLKLGDFSEVDERIRWMEERSNMHECDRETLQFMLLDYRHMREKFVKTTKQNELTSALLQETENTIQDLEEKQLESTKRQEEADGKVEILTYELSCSSNEREDLTIQNKKLLAQSNEFEEEVHRLRKLLDASRRSEAQLFVKQSQAETKQRALLEEQKQLNQTIKNCEIESEEKDNEVDFYQNRYEEIKQKYIELVDVRETEQTKFEYISKTCLKLEKENEDIILEADILKGQLSSCLGLMLEQCEDHEKLLSKEHEDVQIKPFPELPDNAFRNYKEANHDILREINPLNSLDESGCHATSSEDCKNAMVELNIESEVLGYQRESAKPQRNELIGGREETLKRTFCYLYSKASRQSFIEYLSERQDALLISFDALLSRIHHQNNVDINQIRKEAKRNIQDMKRENDTKIVSLNQSLANSLVAGELCSVELSLCKEECLSITSEAGRIKEDMASLQQRYNSNHSLTSKLKEDLFIRKQRLESLTSELNDKIQNMSMLEENLTETGNKMAFQTSLQAGLHKRINNLEQNQREVNEKEQKRLQTNTDVGLQIYPEQRDTSIQVDLVRSDAPLMPDINTTVYARHLMVSSLNANNPATNTARENNASLHKMQLMLRS